MAPDHRRLLRRTWRDETVKDLAAAVIASDDERNLFEAIKRSTRGHLLKNLTVAEFFRMVRRKPALSPSMARQLLSEVRSGAFGRAGSIGAEPLTSREQEVLQLLVQGVTTTNELAERLVVTPNTIKFHLRNILDKLHLHNRAEVVAYASRYGLAAPRE